MSFSMSGIASGLNTATMIDQLMQLERIPYNNLETKKKDLKTSQELFRTINTKLNTLKTATTELTYNSSFNISTVKSSDESAVRVSGTSKAATGNYNIEVEKLAKSHVIKSSEFSATGNTLKPDDIITIDGVDFKLRGNNDAEVLENLKNDINGKSKSISAAVVETSTGNKTLVLTSTNTGKKNTINSATGPQIAGLDKIGITGSLTDPNGNMVQDSSDARLKVNGLVVESATNEIKGVIDGVTITVLKENSSSLITAQKDTNKVYENVKKFVDAFNDVRKLIRENTAKDKPMQGDSTLRQLDMELTDWVTKVVGDTPATKVMLADIGIDMDKGKKGSEMTGQLTLDEKKFKEVFENNPDKVITLFNFEGSSNGIARNINDKIDGWTSTTNGILNSRIKGYDSEISFVDDSMENMLIRLEKKEQSLKRQFTSMEVAMGKLQSEGNWLNSQLAGLSKSKG